MIQNRTGPSLWRMSLFLWRSCQKAKAMMMAMEPRSRIMKKLGCSQSCTEKCSVVDFAVIELA